MSGHMGGYLEGLKKRPGSNYSDKMPSSVLRGYYERMFTEQFLKGMKPEIDRLNALFSGKENYYPLNVALEAYEGLGTNQKAALQQVMGSFLSNEDSVLLGEPQASITALMEQMTQNGLTRQVIEDADAYLKKVMPKQEFNRRVDKMAHDMMQLPQMKDDAMSKDCKRSLLKQALRALPHTMQEIMDGGRGKYTADVSELGQGGIFY